MSHMIDTSNQRENMAYIGKMPWHGLGHLMPDGADIDQWRIAAGLNWEVEPRAVFHGVVDDQGNKRAQVIDGRKALVRSDTQACLSIVSDRYQIVQPGETLEFFRDLVDSSQFTIETVGSLNGGRRIWALARGNLDLRIMGQDLLKPYVLLATGFDGQMATCADFTTVRVVCNNTLTMAVGRNGSKAGIKVHHNTKFNANTVKSELGLIDENLENFANDVDQLANTKVSEADAIKYFIGLHAKLDTDGEVSNIKSVEHIVATLLDSYKRGPGSSLQSSKGTAWGLVSAVTHYEDFEARARSNGNRFNSSQFGLDANRKVKAFANALALAA